MPARDAIHHQWADSELEWAHAQATKRLKLESLSIERRASTFNRAIAYELRRDIRANPSKL